MDMEHPAFFGDDLYLNAHLVRGFPSHVWFMEGNKNEPVRNISLFGSNQYFNSHMFVWFIIQRGATTELVLPETATFIRISWKWFTGTHKFWWQNQAETMLSPVFPWNHLPKITLVQVGPWNNVILNFLAKSQSLVKSPKVLTVKSSLSQDQILNGSPSGHAGPQLELMGFQIHQAFGSSSLAASVMVDLMKGTSTGNHGFFAIKYRTNPIMIVDES